MLSFEEFVLQKQQAFSEAREEIKREEEERRKKEEEERKMRLLRNEFKLFQESGITNLKDYYMINIRKQNEQKRKALRRGY